MRDGFTGYTIPDSHLEIIEEYIINGGFKDIKITNIMLSDPIKKIPNYYLFQ